MKALKIIVLTGVPLTFLLLFSSMYYNARDSSTASTIQMFLGFIIIITLVCAFILALKTKIRKSVTLEFDSFSGE